MINTFVTFSDLKTIVLLSSKSDETSFGCVKALIELIISQHLHHRYAI